MEGEHALNLMFLKAASEFHLKKIYLIKKMFEEELFCYMAQINCTDVILLLIKEFSCEFEYSIPAVSHINILIFYHKDI